MFKSGEGSQPFSKNIQSAKSAWQDDQEITNAEPIMQPFSRYQRALSRIPSRISTRELNQQIDTMVIRRLREIQPGDLVRYAWDWPVLRVISVSPKRIETVNDAGGIITFNGVDSVVPGIRLYDPVTVDERLHKVGGT